MDAVFNYICEEQIIFRDLSFEEADALMCELIFLKREWNDFDDFGKKNKRVKVRYYVVPYNGKHAFVVRVALERERPFGGISRADHYIFMKEVDAICRLIYEELKRVV